MARAFNRRIVWVIIPAKTSIADLREFLLRTTQNAFFRSKNLDYPRTGDSASTIITNETGNNV